MSDAAARPARWFSRSLLRGSVGLVAAVVAGILAFQVLGIPVFRRIGMPHLYCYLQDPKLVGLHVVSDLLIGIAYVSISATLGYLVFKASRGIPFHWVFLAFGLFIISCGLTHFMEVLVIWVPLYWLSGFIKVVTAVASVATAVALFPLVPQVFRLIQSAKKSEDRRIEIEQLNQDLERFNYSVAHDLRAPLRGIAGFSQALREDFAVSLSPEAVAYLERIEASSGRMDLLITDLLRYATVGRQELQMKAVDLEEVLRAVLALVDDDIRVRKAEVVTSGRLPHVVGDPTLLQVAFQNLIGNAAKFVAPAVRPRVEISARRSGNRIKIFFTDNGIGIPLEAQHRVFGLFERLSPETPGTGIGLAIVHRAIERLGGNIGVASAPSGGGSQFWIELPAV